MAFVDVKILVDPREPEAGPSFTGRCVAVEQNVAERLIQEEIWAQTIWPPNEKPLSQILAEYEASKPPPPADW